MKSRSGPNVGLLALVATVGACVSEPEPVESVDSALTVPLWVWTAQDEACATMPLTTNGSTNGKQISLAGVPLSCSMTYYNSVSPNTAYGWPSACDGYVVELTDIAGLPRTGETVRIADGLNPALYLSLSSRQCEGVIYEARAYVHSTTASAAWSFYGLHRFTGKVGAFGCELIRAPGPFNNAFNNEIPPFPAAADRDKIRIVVKASTLGDQLRVSAGVKIATCPPSPKPNGTICDADDECAGGRCTAGTCCGGPTRKDKALCDWQELMSQT